MSGSLRWPGTPDRCARGRRPGAGAGAGTVAVAAAATPVAAAGAVVVLVVLVALVALVRLVPGPGCPGPGWLPCWSAAGPGRLPCWSRCWSRWRFPAGPVLRCRAGARAAAGPACPLRRRLRLVGPSCSVLLPCPADGPAACPAACCLLRRPASPASPAARAASPARAAGCFSAVCSGGGLRRLGCSGCCSGCFSGCLPRAAPPLWAALIASTSWAFFIEPAPAMPMPPAIALRSASSMELSPPPRFLGAEPASAPLWGPVVDSMVSVT